MNMIDIKKLQGFTIPSIANTGASSSCVPEFFSTLNSDQFALPPFESCIEVARSAPEKVS